MANNGACCCGTFLLIILIIGVGLYGGSFKQVTPLNVGLKINTVTSSIDTTRVYTSGRYFVGLGNAFVTYPLTLQTIEYSTLPSADSAPLRAATSDGNAVQLELSFQFRLQIDKIGQLYRKYEKNYKTRYMSVAENQVKAVVSARFRLEDYYTIRSTIVEVMHAAINQALRSEFAVVEYFQLRSIIAPPTFDTSIINKLIQKQKIETAKQNQISGQVRSDTSVISERAAQQIVKINAEASREAQILLSNANAQGIALRQNTTAIVYKKLKNQLGFNNTNLLQHLFIEYIRRLPSTTKLIIDMPNAIVNV